MSSTSQPDSSPPQTLLLVGAGHAHLHLIQNARRLHDAGLRIVLVSPDTFWYSGLATGVLSGAYPPEADTIDVGRLAAANNVEHIPARITHIDRSRRVAVDDMSRETLYDLISFNIGSVVDRSGLTVADDAHLVDVKPIEQIATLRRALLDRSEPPRRIAVVGAGATGCEVAACLTAPKPGPALAQRVTLFTGADHLLSANAAHGARRSMYHVLQRRGVDVRLRTSVNTIDGRELVLSDAAREHFDLIINAAGLRPPPLFARLGWTTGPHGGLATRATLQSTGDDRTFGAGDCIDFHAPREPLPRLGVFGVRQAPVLLDNLIARAHDRPLRDYEPQKRFLSILNLGAGSALALWGPFYYRGRLAMRLKDHLDRRFLDRYRTGA